MRRSREWLPEKESELADAFIPWIESSGWDVYQEVQFHHLGQVADLVLRRNNTIWVVEMKMSLSLDLLAQADGWSYYSNYTSVVIPDRKSLRKTCAASFAKGIMRDRGIGLIVIGKGFDESYLVEEQIHPSLRRKKHSKEWDFLHEGYKVSGKAGNANGDRWTAFRQTCWNLWSYLSRNPGATLDQIIKEVAHHYHTTSTAKQCLLKWINRRVIRGVRVDESHRPYRFYLEDGFDWKAEAKLIT